MVSLDQVSLSYGEKKVLQQIDLSIREGQTHILLGLSGSGKSTIIKILLGLIEPQGGTILVNKSQLTFPVAYHWRLQFGYVPQEGGLFPHMTAIDNVTMVARILGWDPAKISSRIEEILPLVSIPSTLLQRYPKELSGGQKQRFSLMRALFLNPSILLFDEPLGALDPLIRNDLQNELKILFKDLNKTVIFVTHDVSEAAFLGDQITLLRDGRALQTGSFYDLKNKPSDEFVTRFIHAQRTTRDL